MNRNLDEGLGLIRKAVDLRPSDGYIVDSLGWAYYRLGDYPQAVDWLGQIGAPSIGDGKKARPHQRQPPPQLAADDPQLRPVDRGFGAIAQRHQFKHRQP